jgi:hypothetical protein
MKKKNKRASAVERIEAELERLEKKRAIAAECDNPTILPAIEAEIERVSGELAQAKEESDG